MAKIRKINKLLTEDFPSKYSDLVGKLAFVINPFLDNLVEALDGRLNFTDNLDAEVKELRITPTSDLPLRIRTGLTFCDTILVGRVTNLTNTSATLTTPPFVEYSNVEDGAARQIEITNITGLVTTDTYRIKLILLNE